MKRVHFLTIVAILGLLVLGTAQPAHAGALPDLTIVTTPGSGAAKVAPGPCFVIHGHSYQEYRVSNTGSASSGAFMITIKDSAGAIKQSLTTPSLSPGSTRSFWHAMEGCGLYRKIILDSANIVLESDEFNNTLVFGFQIFPTL
jgi:CARDB protein